MGREQMKRIGIAVLITAMVLSFSGCKLGDNIKINEKNFPDENLRTAVQEYDTDNNGWLSPEECAAVTSVDKRYFHNLTGLEHFTNITVLELSNCSYADFDFSCFKGLKELKISGSFSHIDLSANLQLEKLDCISG